MTTPVASSVDKSNDSSWSRVVVGPSMLVLSNNKKKIVTGICARRKVSKSDTASSSSVSCPVMHHVGRSWRGPSKTQHRTRCGELRCSGVVKGLCEHRLQGCARHTADEQCKEYPIPPVHFCLISMFPIPLDFSPSFAIWIHPLLWSNQTTRKLS